MDHLIERRLRPARIFTILSLMAAFGSAAWADIQILEPDSSSNEQLHAGQAAALSTRAVHRSRSLRIRLIEQKRQDRREAELRRKRALERRRAAEAAAAAEAAEAEGSVVDSVSSTLQADWYAIAQCESGGVWSINSGNGYWGGLQFAPSTWFAYGGGPFDGEGPFPYSAGEQIAVAERVLASQGPSAWPNCFVAA